MAGVTASWPLSRWRSGGAAGLTSRKRRLRLSRVNGLAGAPAAGEFGGQRVERLGKRPERVSQPGQPRPGGADPGLVECVDPARAHGTHAHEAGYSQHLEVLGDGRLRDRRP